MDHARLFIAVPVPGSVRTALANRAAALLADDRPDALRSVSPYNYHITVRFLGDTPRDKIASVGTMLTPAVAQWHHDASETDETATGDINLEVDRWGVFPRRGHPRVLWAGIRDPSEALGSLKRAVDRQLAKVGTPPEGRRFFAHITIGYARRGHPADRFRDLAASAFGTPIQLVATRLALYESTLGPGGSHYTELSVTPLSPPRQVQQPR